MFAYIPARGGSKRIPQKNIRFLGGEPIIGRVISTLKSLPFINSVYVSTDSEQIRSMVEEYGSECLELRAATLSDDVAGFGELIKGDMGRFCEHADSSEALFVLATAALVPRQVYLDAYQLFLEKKPEMLMSSGVMDDSPFWAFKSKDDGFWSPVFPEMVRINSQDLPTARNDAGLFYFLNVPAMAKYDCHKLAERIIPFNVDPQYAVDVDTEADWKRLEDKFFALQSGDD